MDLIFSAMLVVNLVFVSLVLTSKLLWRIENILSLPSAADRLNKSNQKIGKKRAPATTPPEKFWGLGASPRKVFSAFLH